MVDTDREDVFDGWIDAMQDGTDFETPFHLMTDGREVEFEAVCNKGDLGTVVGFFGKLQVINNPTGEDL